MTEVKICGLTRPEDVRMACALGANYVGFVFAAGSPRQLNLRRARELSEAVSGGAARVGVFVDEDYSFISEAVRETQLDFVQVHRPLRAKDLDEIAVPIVAVARISETAGSLPDEHLLARCRAILVDSSSGEFQGGTGRRFNWDLLAGRDVGIPLFVAGGLDPENVGEAIRRFRPSAVDVSSGVEATPGAKDPQKLAQFFAAVKEADGHAR
jgi:phosphoribosylanthranilate isomerase